VKLDAKSSCHVGRGSPTFGPGSPLMAIFLAAAGGLAQG
jgi:hypothetical protein